MSGVSLGRLGSVSQPQGRPGTREILVDSLGSPRRNARADPELSFVTGQNTVWQAKEGATEADTGITYHPAMRLLGVNSTEMLPREPDCS